LFDLLKLYQRTMRVPYETVWDPYLFMMLVNSADGRLKLARHRQLHPAPCLYFSQVQYCHCRNVAVTFARF
jgi:hypothetical protein